MANIEEQEKILTSVEEKVFSQGFTKVTVEEIAQDLGMSKKTIYKFFPSKEDIMRALMRMNMRRLEKQVISIVESDKPFEEKFTAFFGTLGRITSKISRPLLRDIQKHIPELGKEIDEFRREKIFGRLRSMFTQAKDEGFLRKDLNEDIFMMMFINSVQNIVTPSVLAEHSFSASEAARQIFQTLFEGILTDESRTRFHFFELHNKTF